MADEIVKKIPKPVMKNLLRSQIKRSLIGCTIFCTVVVGAFKMVVCDGRKRAYAEFYKNYDIDKEFNKMRRKGLFDSCDHEAADEDCL